MDIKPFSEYEVGADVYADQMSTRFWGAVFGAAAVAVGLVALCYVFPSFTPVAAGIAIVGNAVDLILHAFSGRALRQQRAEINEMKRMIGVSE
jgi:hypothetical protein